LRNYWSWRGDSGRGHNLRYWQLADLYSRNIDSWDDNWRRVNIWYWNDGGGARWCNSWGRINDDLLINIE